MFRISDQKWSGSLRGRTIYFRCPSQGFFRYGDVIAVDVRTKFKGEEIITKTGKRVKRPTVEAVIVRLHNGKELRVPFADVVAVHYRMIDRPMPGWKYSASEGRWERDLPPVPVKKSAPVAPAPAPPEPAIDVPFYEKKGDV